MENIEGAGICLLKQEYIDGKIRPTIILFGNNGQYSDGGGQYEKKVVVCLLYLSIYLIINIY